MPKVTRITTSQISVLCTFFEDNPEVIKGYRKLPKCIEAVQTKWKKISSQLNLLGPRRDHKEWAKYICNVKAKLKRKRIKWRQNSDGTGPIICNADDFNEIELRMLQVLRKETPNSQHVQGGNISDNEMEEDSSSNVEDDSVNIFNFQDCKNDTKPNHISFTELEPNDTPPEPITRQIYLSQNKYSDKLDTFGTNTRITTSQISVLCTFFEDNPEVIKGYRKSPKCKETVQTKWKEISPQLNLLGPRRHHKEWAKYLCNIKANLKRKHIKWRQNSDGTGPIICNADDFNEIELRMLQVLRKETPNSQHVQGGNISVNEMEDSSSNVEDVSVHMFNFQDCKNNTKQNHISYSELEPNEPLEPYTRQIYLSQNNYCDEFDTFGKNIAQQLRTLPLAIALETQELLLAVTRKQRLKVLKSKTNNDSGNMDLLDK